MTEAAFGELPPPDEGFDAADPANNSAVVVALCADEAQDITGQVFFVYGGVVNMLRGWEAGELFSAGDSRWEPEACCRSLKERLPGRRRAAGMLASMHAAGGSVDARMTTTLTIDELEGSGERELGTSSWHDITQEQVNMFAEATGDRQWIHVDPERAAAGPFGSTVAHGYLTLSMLPMLLAEVVSVSDAAMGLELRHRRRSASRTPFRSARVCVCSARLTKTQRRGPSVIWNVGVEVEIEGKEKPALVGEVVYMAAGAPPA
jgi:acyl dehydratase